MYLRDCASRPSGMLDYVRVTYDAQAVRQHVCVDINSVQAALLMFCRTQVRG